MEPYVASSRFQDLDLLLSVDVRVDVVESTSRDETRLTWFLQSLSSKVNLAGWDQHDLGQFFIRKPLKTVTTKPRLLCPMMLPLLFKVRRSS